MFNMETSETKILLATQNDISDLIGLFRQTEEYHRANRPDVFAEPPRTDLEELFNKFIQSPMVTTLLAKTDNIPVGFLRYRIYEAPKISFLVDVGTRHGVIEELVVTTTRRREGLGKRLIEEAEKRLAELGIRHIQLDVFNFNLPAQALYKELGYNPLFFRLSKTIG